jgi:hypothetical protein
VQAYNVIGWSNLSPVNLSGARIPQKAPGIPSAPKLEENRINSITVSWLSVKHATAYELF